MECPECGGSSKVVDSRKYAGAVYRKRECKSCSFVFWTEEIEIDSDSAVLKEMRAALRMRSRDNLKKGNP